MALQKLGLLERTFSNSKKDEAIELYYAKYSERHNQLVTPHKEIDDLIQYLKEEGLKIGIFTGKAKRSLDISVNALQMDGLFDVIITGDDVNKPKPHPEGLLKALSLLAVKSCEALFIGDSDADIDAGVQANVHTVGVQWLPDYHSMEFINEPDAIFKGVTEFIDSMKIGVTYEY